ncbi:MAG TPA: 3-carboxy-cis,cis-muconate cycloisomerase [Bryobacteraceae bacterium]|nr:3-carboxy-cis,cis-muconate cycloisomerase [Bryobacteraceae bacterium]
MSERLIDSLVTTPALAELFSDDSMLQAMLEFEAALARVEARLGLIPAAETLLRPEIEPEEVRRAGTPAVPFVKAITATASYAHWGATSQDVTDTALVLLLKQARVLLAADCTRLCDALVRLSDEHAGSVMLARTLLQAASPVTFGLKAAGWLAAIRRSWQRLNDAFAEAFVLQFGGASGTVAALGDHGLTVGSFLAGELDLAYPDGPWHAHRDRLANVVCSCGVLTGTLGKMARDIALLMQNEVGEAVEPVEPGRGGSSTMPHKQNPVGCARALAAAYRVPGLVSTFLSAMMQEHERGIGNWHIEWPTISEVVQATGSALAAMAEVAEGLIVDPDRMKANIEATNGRIYAERAMFLLAAKMGRAAAHKLVEEAARQSRAENRPLQEFLPELDSTESYLGVAEEFRQRLRGE